MAVTVEFTDNTIEVVNALQSAAESFLYEAGEEVKSAAQRNSRTDTGQFKGKWKATVNTGNLSVQIGHPDENAIWEEFGTGEYAENGGRKGGWLVPGSELTPKAKSKMQKRIVKGEEKYFTRGKTPNHTLKNAFDSTKTRIIMRAQQIFNLK